MMALLRLMVCGLDSEMNRDLGAANPRDEPAPHYRHVDIHSVYELGARLGQSGTFGEAREGVHRVSGAAVAIKTVRKHKCPVKMLRVEEHVLKMLDHEHIARLHSVYETKKAVFFVLERCNGGDLIDSIVRAGGRLSEVAAARNAFGLAQALHHLHSKGVAHCDLKPSNIMFSESQREQIVKLIDFGVSQRIREGQSLHAEVGSPSFMAPEVISGCYSQMCDLWSLGVVLFVCLFGFNPWNPCAEQCLAVHRRICARVLRGFDPSVRPGFGAFFPESVPVSAEARHLIASLLNSDPAKRPDASAVLAHPWIRAHVKPSSSSSLPSSSAVCCAAAAASAPAAAAAAAQVGAEA